jgi:hypothetical protein
VVLQAPVDQQEEDRHEEDGQHRRCQHAADHARADIILRARTRAKRLPLMLIALIAYGVSRFFQRESLYHAMAPQFLLRQQPSRQSRALGNANSEAQI